MAEEQQVKRVKELSSAHLWLATDACLFEKDASGAVEDLLDSLEDMSEHRARREILRSIKNQDPVEAFMERKIMETMTMGVLFIVGMVASKLTNHYLCNKFE